MANPLFNAYSFPTPFNQPFPSPVVAQRAPTSSDVRNSSGVTYGFGQIWVDQNADTIYALSNISSGNADWEVLGGSGSDVNTLTGDSGGAISPSGGNINLLGGSGISTVGSGSTITFNVTGAGLEYTEVTGTSQAMAINQGYVLNNVGLVTATLPAVAAFGSVVAVVGKGSGGWRIAQNAGQTVHQNSTDSTTGVGGSVSSTARYNTAYLVCITANTDWVVYDSQGILTFV
jgi:hypothetical protein